MKRSSIRNLEITTQILLGFTVVFFSVLVAITISHFNSNQIIDSSESIVKTQEILTQVGNIDGLLVDLETGQRGFLITGNEEYLEPFNKSKKVIYEELNKIRYLTIDYISQTQRIDSLEKIVDKKIEELELTISLRRNVSYEAAKAIVNNDSGKIFMDQIRKLIYEIEKEELRLLAIKTPQPDAIKKRTNTLLLTLFAFTTVIVVVVSFLVYQAINKPIEIIQEGLKEVAKGDLDYKFKIKTENEFGVLARFIENVLSDLKNTIVSKNDLENEIILRKHIERDLTKIQKRLKSKNKELEQFGYLTSHDLQEPLNTIISYTSLLEDEKENMSELSKKSIEVIKSSSYRMKEFIKELLEYSKIGKRLEKSEIDVITLLNSIKEDLFSLTEQTKATITYIGRPIKIKGYEVDLMKLFQNLIVNGIKYSKEETRPVITIDVREEDENYLFSVSDNGIGIEENQFEKIFQIFQRLHNRNDYSGTGIGLAHCKKVVNLHNGKIWVTSKVGKGSTFYFTLAKK